ncbi:MAG: dihydrolipoamide acyltransferase [Sulfuriferula sp.]
MSATPRRLLSILMLCATLAACAALPVSPSGTTCVNVPPPLPLPPAPLPTETSRLTELMQYYEYLRKQPPLALVQEYKKASQDFLQTESDSSRVRVAILLALPDTPFHDVPAALNLLSNWPEDEKVSPPALDGFARLLSVLLVQQQQSTNTVNDLTQKLKEEKKRAETLQGQIDAVKNMEKNLIDRNKQ